MRIMKKMLDKLNSFYYKIPKKDKQNIKKVIIYIAYFLHLNEKEIFTAKDLKKCLEKLHLNHNNIPLVLSRESIGKNKSFIKHEKGQYKLYRNKIDELDELFGNINYDIKITKDFFDMELLENASVPYYIKNIAKEMCLCYDSGCYTACLVMMRKLLEALIIETFINKGIERNIRNGDNYLYLSGLINIYLSEDDIKKSRNIPKKINSIKELGDTAAHTGRFKANKSIVDNIKNDLNIVVQNILTNAY